MGFDSRYVQGIYFVQNAPRPALKPIQPHILWVPLVLYPGRGGETLQSGHEFKYYLHPVRRLWMSGTLLIPTLYAIMERTETALTDFCQFLRSITKVIMSVCVWNQHLSAKCNSKCYAWILPAVFQNFIFAWETFTCKLWRMCCWKWNTGKCSIS